MAKNWWDDAPLADEGGNWWESAPIEQPTPEPSWKDQLYATANKLFREKSVMDELDGTDSPVPYNPVAAQAIDKLLAEGPPSVVRALPDAPAQVSGLPGLLEVGARQGIGGLHKSVAGGIELIGDALDLPDVANYGKEAAQRSRQFIQGAELQRPNIEGFAPGSIVNDLPQAAASAGGSIISNIPAIVASAATGNPSVGLAMMGAQSATGEYSEGRADGLTGTGAFLRAAPMGAAEVIGEKIGGHGLVSHGVRDAVTERSVEPLARAMIAGGLREMPGEEVTTASQFGIDKLPGVGLKQDATIGDLVQQMKDTALTTALQGGAMAGGGMALQKLAGQPQQPVALAPGAQPVAQPAAPADVAGLSNLIANTASVPSKLQTEAKQGGEWWKEAPLAEDGAQIDMEGLRAEAQAMRDRPPTEQDLIGRAEVAPQPAVNSTEEVQNATDPASVEAINAAATQAAGPDVNQSGAEVANEAASGEQSLVDRPVEPAATRQDTAQAIGEQEQPKYEVPAQLTERAMQLEHPTEGLRPGDIVAAGGKPFSTKAKAQVEAKLAGQGWTIKKGAGGFVVRYQPATEKQRANAARLVQQQARVNPESDSLHMAIAKLGGINFDQLTKEWGYDLAEIRTLRHGIKRIGTKSGMSLDRAGEALAELGYLSRDEHGKHDLGELFDLFDGELRGDPHYTPQGFERKMEAHKEAEYQAWLDQQDKEALNAQTDEQQQAIETLLDEYDAISADEEAAIEREASATEPGATLGGTIEGSDASTEEGINGTAGQTDQQAPGASGTGERPADSPGGTGTVISERPERRQDPERSKTVSDMTPEEMRRALLVDELTGLGNRRAYVESNKKQYQAAIDIDSLKWVNDHMGHESGDQLLALFGQALADETQEGYHLSGDEFAAQFDNEEEGRNLLERVRERLSGVVIEITHDDGSITRKNGVEFSYGIDNTLQAADRRLLEDKARREQAGLRAARGREPFGVSKTPAARQQDNPGLPTSEEVSRPARQGITPDEARAAISADTFNHSVDVYATLNDAPDYIQSQAKSEGETGVEGFWDLRTNRVALVAENLPSPERAVEVARHELIGHYGIANMIGADEMERLAQRVLKAEQEGNGVIIDLAKHVDEFQPGLPADRRAREIIAVMAERNIQNSITKRVLDAIRKFLKSIGFVKKDITDAEIAGLLRDAQAYLREQGREMMAGGPAAFSRSAMKSVEANIARGKNALNRAIMEQTTVHRAMFRNGLGWVDFVWGDVGRLLPSGKTKGAMGLSHIIEARMRKDGQSYAQAVNALHGLVETIASGNEFDRKEISGNLRVGIDDGRYIAWLVKPAGSNAWIVTGYEKTPGGQTAGRATNLPTNTATSRTRDSVGAEVQESVPQDLPPGSQDDNLGNDASFSRGEQGGLPLDEQRDPIRARDFVSAARDVSARRRWVAGQKGYDRLVDAINPLLAKVKLSNDAPDAFKQMMRQFAVDQNKALENAKRVAEAGTQTLTPEERILISDIIEKNAAAGDLPPENVAKIAADITAALKQQSQELVDLGMTTPDRLIENYLPRAYRNPLLARLTNKEMFVSWYQKAKLRMNGNRLKSRGLVDVVRLEDIEKYEKLGWHLSAMSDGENIPDDLWDAIQTNGKIPPQYAQDLKFLMWRDFTEEERAQMGEIRDGILRYAMGYTETQRDIAIGRLFKAIAENDELSSAVNPGGWARVPDQDIPGTPGLKRYGALSGLFVPPYVRDVIERSTQPKGPLMQMYDKALSFWKEGKTVWNPVSHGNNIVSNVFVMHYAGLNPADPRPWRSTVREYRTKGQYYQEAVDNGLFGTEFASKEIQELFLPDLTDDLDVETVVASRFNKVVEAMKKAGKPISWYRDKMQKAYEFEDQFFKLMIFADRRKAGASIEDAIADTERYIFNYSDIPEGVELAKRIYSPFISYTYKALPMLVHTAMTRPDRLLLPIALLGGANWLAYAITGGDEEKERKGMPEYLQGRTAIGTPKALRMPFNIGDRPAFLDLSRRVPLGDLFDLTNQTGGLAVPAPLMPSHPMFTATAAMLFNIDTFTGKPVTQNSDTAWESAQKRANWAWKQMMPNAPFVPGSWNWDKLMNGAANAFDTEMMGYTGYTKAGDPIPLSTALLDVTTGTKIRSFDPERGIDFKEYQFDKERKEIQANIRSAMRNKSMTPEARRDYVDRQQDKMKELQKRRAELK